MRSGLGVCRPRRTTMTSCGQELEAGDSPQCARAESWDGTSPGPLEHRRQDLLQIGLGRTDEPIHAFGEELPGAAR